MLIEMIALRDFPLGTESRTLIRAGATYSVDESLVGFHEQTGRGIRRKPAAKPAKKAD